MEILKNIFIVGAGSFIGGAARYIMMLQDGNIWGFTVYVCTSVIAGIALTALGYYLTR